MYYYETTRLRESQQVTFYPSWIAKTFLLNQSERRKYRYTNYIDPNKSMYFGCLLTKAICILECNQLFEFRRNSTRIKNLTRERRVIPLVYATQFDDLLIVKNNLYVYIHLQFYSVVKISVKCIYIMYNVNAIF